MVSPRFWIGFYAPQAHDILSGVIQVTAYYVSNRLLT